MSTLEFVVAAVDVVAVVGVASVAAVVAVAAVTGVATVVGGVAFEFSVDDEGGGWVVTF